MGAPSIETSSGLPPPDHSPSRHTFLRRLLTFAGILYVSGTVFGGIGLGWIALHPPRRPVTFREEANVQETANAASGKFERVSLITQDGTTLNAWFLTPHSANGNAVILLHGVSDNRLGMYGYGKWLLNKNYSVLLPDARGHGLSDGLASYFPSQK